MSKAPSDSLRNAVERQHGGKATLAKTVPVREEFQGQLAFEGLVHVYDLEGSPSRATRAYAWARRLDGEEDERYRVFAVLHIGPIKSPADAVRAAIVAEHRAHN